MSVRTQTIDIEIRPRRHFRAFLESTARWHVLVAHRRAGKTVAVVQKLIKEALTHHRKGPPLRYAYIAPTRDQAKDIAWQYLKDYTAYIPGAVPNEAELRIMLPNKAQIRLYSDENYERMRGLYFDGIVSDEDADIPPEAFTFVVLPCLLDYKGWHCRIGTPKGRNSFYRAYQRAAASDDHYSMLLKASESGIIDEDSLREIRAEIGETAYAQEMECNFHVARAGSIYGQHIDDALSAGRISAQVEFYKGLPVYTAWDLGAAVNTKCWIYQVVGDSINYLESLTDGAPDMQDPGDWARELKTRQYAYGGHFLPHDGEVLWQRMLTQAGLTGVVCVPKCVMVWDPINDAKASLGRCRFHEEQCREGLDALENYHSKEERDGITIKDVPVHDWASHYASAFACSHQAIRAGMLVDRSAIPEAPDDAQWRHPEEHVITGFTGPSHLRNIR